MTGRISAFSSLGDRIKNLSNEEFQSISQKAQSENPWFTPENIHHAFDGISRWFHADYLHSWIAKYDFSHVKPKSVGIIMAGNLPLVGFHDLMCVVLSGHRAVIKTSSQDQVLTKLMIEWLTEDHPSLREQVSIQERLNNQEAIIATGSNNTSRYFEYYFRNIPHIIRKSRTSVAILRGSETEEELQLLGKDIFWYFGLGCRNVSKVFIPKGYSPEPFFKAIESYAEVGNHHKYRNNYDYQKSILLINNITHLDNGFLLWVPTLQLVSPISVVYVEEYEDEESLKNRINSNAHMIQCVVGHGNIPFGKAQLPEAWEYADAIDTLKFLSEI